MPAASGHVFFAAFLFLGEMSAVLAEANVPPYLRKRNIGISKGSRTLRRVQVGCVAAGALLGVAVEGVSYTEFPKDVFKVAKREYCMPNIQNARPLSFLRQTHADRFLPVCETLK